jgi:16S rRNA C967 or C1407 C5-methylase (RsmB/RsmF family)
VESFLAAHPAFVPAPPPPTDVAWSRLGAGAPHLVRLWPDRDDADAFFAARLQRRA